MDCVVVFLAGELEYRRFSEQLLEVLEGVELVGIQRDKDLRLLQSRD